MRTKAANYSIADLPEECLRYEFPEYYDSMKKDFYAHLLIFS